LRRLTGLARQQPVLMIFEDLHWADPSSRELLDIPIEQIGRLPVLLVATFRSRLQAPKSGVAFQRFSKERDRFMRPAEHEFCGSGGSGEKEDDAVQPIGRPYRGA